MFTGTLLVDASGDGGGELGGKSLPAKALAEAFWGRMHAEGQKVHAEGCAFSLD